MVMFGWFINGCPDTVCGAIEVFLPEKTQQLGVTAFYFAITPYGISLNRQQQDYSWSFEDYCDKNISSGKKAVEQGRGCTAWVIYKENMDYLHFDDLSWDDKTKCSK